MVFKLTKGETGGVLTLISTGDGHENPSFIEGFITFLLFILFLLLFHVVVNRYSRVERSSLCSTTTSVLDISSSKHHSLIPFVFMSSIQPRVENHHFLNPLHTV